MGIKFGSDPSWKPGQFDDALRLRLVEFAALIVMGCQSGSIKSKPIMPLDLDAESLQMTSLEAIAVQLLRDCGAVQ